MKKIFIPLLLIFTVYQSYAQKEYAGRLPFQHIIKTPVLGSINPFYPELQLGYGIHKGDRWALHVTGGWVNGLYYNVSGEDYYKYKTGWRVAINPRLMLTHQSIKTTDYFVGIKYMKSNVHRTVADFFWNPTFEFQEFKKIMSITNSNSFLIESGLTTNIYRRFALEAFFGLGIKSFKRTNLDNSGAAVWDLYNIVERSFAENQWHTIAAMSLSLDLVYRFSNPTPKK